MVKDPGMRILVFTKPALPGHVKTRLVPPLTEVQAAEFHLASLDDVIAAVASAAAGELRLRVAGQDSELDEFRQRYPGVRIEAQPPGNLGDRLAAAFEEEFAGGGQCVVIIGSDHPTLPPEHIARGLGHLGSSDIVLGPSSDGGYYLVGIRHAAWPEARAVFQDIPWSTPQVLEASLEQALALGLSVTLLPEWYDVDRAEDLERLRADAPDDSAAARLIIDWGILSP